MKEVKLNAKDLDENFKGHVVIEVLKSRDRMAYSKRLNFTFGDDGEVVVNKELYDSTIIMIDIAEKHVKEVVLEHIESGVKASSFEDMEYSPEFDGIMTIIGGAILNAGRVGKN